MSRYCRLDGRQRSKQAVLARLAKDLDFPPHFGGNLDALFDVLTADVPGPVHISWRATERAVSTMGEDYARLRTTLEDAARERADLRVDIEAPT